MPNNLFPRLKFRSGNQKIFIESVISNSSLNINEIASRVKVSSRTIRDWRRERYCISKSAANYFCVNFDSVLLEPEDLLINRWKQNRRKNCIKGANSRYKIYGNPGTNKGRVKGGNKSIKILRKKGVFASAKKYKTPFFCNDLAEWFGILLGDGGLTKTQVRISLNSVADSGYIDFVSKLSEKLLEEKPKIYKENNKKVVYVCFSGKNLVSMLLKLGLKTGNKVKQQVQVPSWIQTSKKFRISCVRGLMDTDGGIFLHKYKVREKNYIYKKICFSNRSIPLLNFVFDVLKESGFSPKLRDNVENTSVWLYNTNEVSKYLELIGSNNPRLLKFKGGVA